MSCCQLVPDFYIPEESHSLEGKESLFSRITSG